MTELLGIATNLGPGLTEVFWKQGGLAVGPAFGDDRELGWKYVITHVPSGRGVVWFRSRDTATRAAKNLLAAGNWDRPFADVVADTSLMLATQAWRIKGASTAI